MEHVTLTSAKHEYKTMLTCFRTRPQTGLHRHASRENIVTHDCKHSSYFTLAGLVQALARWHRSPLGSKEPILEDTAPPPRPDSLPLCT